MTGKHVVDELQRLRAIAATLTDDEREVFAGDWLRVSDSVKWRDDGCDSELRRNETA